ncbi:DNA topoisomerase IB [Bailinhaonella thermotolerans]|uniref:DNA topoisomerase IB n=1 Tax=Bailinhaonella thermotolerans TaxID=1070861 RepID=UPI001F5B99B8|nr:DNA topoisomerase IB [Bailinhaonella thermotolerans]
MDELPGGLRRSDPSEPGITRVRRGRGFQYFDPAGEPLGEGETLRRVKALVIPPAWTDVWICPDADGHIQALGTDAAGRRQYRYHDAWREAQDRAKHEHVLDMAERLPAVRERLAEHLAERGLTRQRVLAAAVRLLDLGFFRVGGEEYAEENGSFGLATLRQEHVRCVRGRVHFEYPAKSGKTRTHDISDPEVCKVVRALRARGEGELLRYRQGTAWHDVRSHDINDYLRELFGIEVTAKDFRTWHATVLAAVGLAVSRPVTTEAARKRAVARVMSEVAAYLGNTPAVTRASYVDPRIIALYERGRTIAPILTDLGADVDPGHLATQGPAEQAVLRLLRSA